MSVVLRMKVSRLLKRPAKSDRGRDGTKKRSSQGEFGLLIPDGRYDAQKLKGNGRSRSSRIIIYKLHRLPSQPSSSVWHAGAMVLRVKSMPGQKKETRPSDIDRWTTLQCRCICFISM